MFSAHTIHLLHIVIRDFLIALVVLVAALFFWLLHGIQVDRIDVGSYKVVGLYIKLDKKLILKAKSVTIPESKDKPSFEGVDATFDRIKNLLSYFETIHLEHINFKNNHLTVLFADDVLYITSDDYEIAGNIVRKGNKLIADVPLLYIKKEKISIAGKLTYDLAKNTLETGGKFEAYGIKGHFRAVQHDNSIVYAVNTETFTNLEPLITRFSLPKTIEDWTVRKVRAKRYRVEYIKGRIDIVDHQLKPDIGGLKAQGRFEDVSIYYKKGLDPVHAKALTLRYKKGNLYFDLEKPQCKGRDLSGTHLVIKHIVGVQKPVLILDLKIQSAIDGLVAKILKAYNITLPVSHTGKRNSINIGITIPLGKQKRKLLVSVEVKLDKGVLHIGSLKLPVNGGWVLFNSKSGKATLKDVQVNARWYKGTIEGTIDTLHHKADLVLHIKRFILGKEKSPDVEIVNRKIPMILSYGTQLRFTLPTLKVTLTKKGEGIHIFLSDLSKILPYLKNNMLGITGGELHVTGNENGMVWHFNGRVQKDVCFFYDSKDVCYTAIPLEGTFNTATKQVNLYAFDKRVHINTAKGRITLTDINIDLKRFMEEQKKLMHKSGNSSMGLKKTFVIIGKKSQLRYGKRKLVTDSYDIEIKPNGNIKAIGSSQGNIIKLTKKGKILTVEVLRVTDRVLHPLIGFDGLKQGRYSLKLTGDPVKLMKGRIIIEGGVLSDFKAYSNTLAFINTLPALATLSKPGFSNKGFKISEGVVEYHLTPQKLVFDSVYLKGNSATVTGKGVVNLKSRKIDIKLAIQTVREFGKMVGKIPLLGYILMGDDNSMTVGLEVTGTLENPKVNTSVAKDILTLPLQILKRTIEAPGYMQEHAPKQVAPQIPDRTMPNKQSKAVPAPSMSSPKKDGKKSHPIPSMRPKAKGEASSVTQKEKKVPQPTRSEAPSAGQSVQLF